MQINKLILVFVILFLVVGCKPTQNMESNYTKQGYTIVTVLDNRKVDGCQFLLTDDNNKRYEPTTLPDSVRVNGLKIGVKFNFVKGGVSACMGGPLIKVSEIVYLKK
jgi:hypothetical protein